MLRELRIENLLLLEKAELRVGEGLNAITGETGAGKTVLAHSLDLLMGGRAKAQVVRPGAQGAWVEGVFDLPQGLLGEPEVGALAERLPAGAEEVVLGRRSCGGGRTRACVAGRAARPARVRLLGGGRVAGVREAAGARHVGLDGAEEDGGGAAAALAEAESLLRGAAGVGIGSDAISARVAALAIELGDVGSELRDYAEGLESDPGALPAIEERLEAIDRLERKHGGSVESVLAHAERCREEIERLAGAEGRGAQAEGALVAGQKRRPGLGQRLSGRPAHAARPP